MSGESVSIKISSENYRRLLALAGELQHQRRERVTIDEAIAHLFENQKRGKRK